MVSHEPHAPFFHPFRPCILTWDATWVTAVHQGEGRGEWASVWRIRLQAPRHLCSPHFACLMSLGAPRWSLCHIPLPPLCSVAVVLIINRRTSKVGPMRSAPCSHQQPQQQATLGPGRSPFCGRGPLGSPHCWLAGCWMLLCGACPLPSFRVAPVHTQCDGQRYALVTCWDEWEGGGQLMPPWACSIPPCVACGHAQHCWPWSPTW